MVVFEYRFSKIASLLTFVFVCVSTLYAETSKVGSACARIVSLAPSITEVIYALNLDPALVGVTRYDRYPDDVVNKQKIGGFLDPNFEAILALKPSVVMLTKDLLDNKTKLGKLEITSLSLEHRNVSGILNSVTQVADFCGVREKGVALLEALRREVGEIKTKVSSFEDVPVLVVIGGGASEGRIHNLFVSGRDGFYSELLPIVKGKSVYSGDTINFPVLSLEGLRLLNPEVIIEIVTPGSKAGFNRDKALGLWSSFKGIPAVDNERVYFVDSDYAVIPGPRFVKALRELAKLIHPQVEL